MRNETTTENIFLNDFLMGNNNLQRDIFQEGPLANSDKVMVLNIPQEERKREILNPYNIGRWQNIQEIFGDNYALWFTPAITTKGNGTNFLKNTKDVEDEY
jgi:hypothetical protein